MSIPKLITPNETASILGVTTETLSVWRCTSRYKLPFVKIGSKVFYKESDIENFITVRTQNLGDCTGDK